jgi:hypothetical protein
MPSAVGNAVHCLSPDFLTPDDVSRDTNIGASIFDEIFDWMPYLVPSINDYFSSSDSLASGRRLAWLSWDYGEDPSTPMDADFEEDLSDEVTKVEEVQSARERYL